MTCRGVWSVRGLRVTATGWVYLDGEHIVRPDLAQLLSSNGARFDAEFREDGTNLVIQGALRPHQIQDDRVGGVDALDQLWRSRQRRAAHVHLVRHHDLVDLLAGERVPCRRVPKRWQEFKKYKKAALRRAQEGT